MSSIIPWLLKISREELGHKGRVQDALENLQPHSSVLSTYISEIQDAIDRYNSQSRTHFENAEYFINASHLASIFDQPLPSYQEVIASLRTHNTLFQQVLDELKNSAYFHEVYEISDDGSLIHNLLILYYRTTLLFMHPLLREKEGQISSTLEEMSSDLALQGHHTHLFESTIRWVLNWKEEGFAEELAKKLEFFQQPRGL